MESGEWMRFLKVIRKKTHDIYCHLSEAMQGKDWTRNMQVNTGRTAMTERIAAGKRLLESIFIVILALYPLRHINWGLDLMDTGYNYANHTFMGTEHMDSMWLFSTWISNVMGHWITGLPNAGSLLGMNFYTGLLVSILALGSYWFCIKRLQIRPWIAFVGEMAAISLCWCPTALLYNYLTYLLLLGCAILLYEGLTKEKKGCLIAAGVCLGINVFVRFSNLPEMGLILAVWAYDFICVREEKKLRRTARHTGWCMAGYFGALAVFLLIIQLEYGLSEYFTGITRLFAMTDNATDYKATSMVKKLVMEYVTNSYWVIRILIVVAAGMILFALAGLVKGKISAVIQKAIRLLWAAVSIAVPMWLYWREFCSVDFHTYGSMYRPAVLFIMLTMFIALVKIFETKSSGEEKLISGMLILVLLLTSLGSNNGVYSSINNLFLAAPYTFSQSMKFIRHAGDKKIAHVTISSTPAKYVLTAFLVFCCVQFGGFGAGFAFAEATGVRDISATVENNEVLKGIRMSQEKAQWMTELSAYVNENALKGQELITFGMYSSWCIPSLSYYLQMPAAFNPWMELPSYSYSVMEEKVRGLEENPVIILENHNAIYEEGGKDALLESGVDSSIAERMDEDRKFRLLLDFMSERGYEQTFRNEKFAVYRSAE